jgi:hypothetical protein
MDIKDFKDLEKLLKICRRQGVTEFTLSGFSCKLGDLPTEAGQRIQEDVVMGDPMDPYSNFPSGILSPEALAFYSAGGVPGEEPEGLLNEG